MDKLEYISHGLIHNFMTDVCNTVKDITSDEVLAVNEQDMGVILTKDNYHMRFEFPLFKDQYKKYVCSNKPRSMWVETTAKSMLKTFYFNYNREQKRLQEKRP